MRQIGISPKIVADFFVTVAAFLVASPAVGLDPALSAAIAKALGVMAGYLAPAGSVVAVTPSGGSDERMSVETAALIARDSPIG